MVATDTARWIFEDRATGYAPLARGAVRVDREQGIIYGAKLVGKESGNTHGQPGVTRGTRYSEQAMREELALIPADGAKLNANHPKDRKVRLDREMEDRLGKAKDPFIYEGEIYGDLHLLKTHPLYERLMEAAERMPDTFAISHNARGDGPVINGVWVIETVQELKSFDVVADGGTNKSLFESGENDVKKPMKLKTLCESKPALKEKLAGLFKLLPTAGEMLVEAEEEGGGDYRDHLHAAKKMCEDAGDADMAGKIHGLMKPKKEEGEKDNEASTAADEEKDADKDADKDATKDKEKKAMESRIRDLESKESCRELCESQSFVPSKIQLKALIPLSKDDRITFIKEVKVGRGSGIQSRSLIQPPKEGAGGDLQESATGIPEKPEDQLTWLRS